MGNIKDISEGSGFESQDDRIKWYSDEILEHQRRLSELMVEGQRVTGWDAQKRVQDQIDLLATELSNLIAERDRLQNPSGEKPKSRVGEASEYGMKIEECLGLIDELSKALTQTLDPAERTSIQDQMARARKEIAHLNAELGRIQDF